MPRLWMVCILALPLALPAQESAHTKGPGGLEAWTVSESVPTLEGQGPLPTRMIVARHGKRLETVKGDPFLWSFVFEDGGRQIAYQAGPLHSVMTCILIDVSTGKQLKTQDCFGIDPDTAPAWVQHLINAR